VVPFIRWTRIEWAGHAFGSMLKKALNYNKRKETKGKTTEKMEGQRQGITRRNWSGLGAGI